MKPQDALKKLTAYAGAIKTARKAYVAVGVIEAGGTAAIYGGPTVLEVAASHEYGAGNVVRSFLRMPFEVKAGEINRMTDRQFSDVFEKGKDISQALGLIGLAAKNISLDAFDTEGFGTWAPIEREGKILSDTGTLKNSVTYEVRNVA